MPRDPYCSHCGYSLVGLTESSKCPECGRPLVEVLTRDAIAFRAGKRYKSKTTLFGRPLVHIAVGPYEDELRGRARGIIAIGDVANGWLAIGGMAFGIVAIGGVAFGVAAIGGAAVGLIALGGFALGGFATGGGAVGLVASGGGALGVIAEGGGACGYIARGGGVYATHAVRVFVPSDPLADQFFRRWTWLFGAPGAGAGMLSELWSLIAAVALSLGLALIVLLGLVVRRPTKPD